MPKIKIFLSFSWTAEDREGVMVKQRPNKESSGLVSENRPAFFKIMFPGLSTASLRIPPDFVKHISMEQTQTAVLRGSSGGHRHIKLLKTAKSVFLQDGWQEFVRENSLGDYEFLLFRYDGNISFDVKIFDKNGCLRDNGPNTTTDPKHVFPPLKRPCNGPRKNTDRKLHLNQTMAPPGGSDKVIPRAVKKEKTEHFIGKNSQNKKPKRKSPQIRTETEETALSIHDMHSDTIPSFPARNIPAGKSGSSFSQRIESFTSNFPYFKVLLRRCNASKVFILAIPSQFSQMHLPKSKHKIVLHTSEGKSWVVNTVPTSSSHAFCGGWSTFVQDNLLNEGDGCVFELVKDNEMQVHIFRIRHKWIAAC